MRVLALTRYDVLGASSRVRFFQYFPYLAGEGVHLEVSPLLDNLYVSRLYESRAASPIQILGSYARRLFQLSRSRSFDLLWIEKELLPWLPHWGEALLQRSGVPYVVDYDDAVFHRYDMHSSLLIRKMLGRKIDAVMRLSSITVAGNNYLASRATQAGARRIELLPSVVDLEHYPPDAEARHDEFRVGWIGTPVTAPYLNLIRPALEQVHRQLSLRLVLIGPPPETRLPAIPTETLPWTAATESQNLHSLDVGIMPLPDEPFERGKCGYKLIQYMACGIPVVASPVGANLQIVEHGHNGYVASSIEEWIAALTSLGNDRELRLLMGKAGRQKVEQQYSLQVTAPRLLRILQQGAFP